MRLFRGNTQRGPLPSNIVGIMERFGRFEIDPTRSQDDAGAIWNDTQAPLLAVAQSDPAGFITALANECIPMGGWACYGAERTVVNLVGLDPPGPDWHRLLDASIEFLRSNGVPPIRVSGYMWDYWVKQGGSANTWIPPRPTPSRELAVIKDFADGEVRRVAQLTPGDGNVIFIRRDGDRYVAIIDAKYSDEDPTRSQWDWKEASSAYDLYVDAGLATQMYDWAEPEFEAFLPLPKAAI